MAHSASMSEKCNNNPEGLQQKLHGSQGDLFPFPGFIVNNKIDVEDHTPLTKIPCESVLDYSNSAKSREESSSTCTTNTPPVEPSVSPEIQFNLSRSVLVSGAAPSTCYGAGHVISGVIDRRKCKARGILSVGRKKSLEQDIPGDIFTKSRPSLIPFPPVEASISWHLSPSYVDDNEDDDDVEKVNKPKGLHHSWKVLESAKILSPSSPYGSPCCTSINPEVQGRLDSSLDKGTKKASSTLLETPHHEHVVTQEERITSFDFDGVCSPFSADSLGSGNVMQTPNSDSSLERHVNLSWPKEGIELKHQFEPELDNVKDAPEDKSSPWDPPRLSFELADLSTPFDATNLNHLGETSDINTSWVSNSTSENVSVSQMRVSWRDGLISSTFDKENMDCCRLLSDEETDADGLLKSPRLPEHDVRDDENGKETSFPLRPNPCAESICTDDDGLIASGDSDWTVYYKNRSFEI